MPSVVLAIDVGNSRIKLGLLEWAAGSGGAAPASLPRCVRVEAVGHEEAACRAALRALSEAAGGAPLTGIVAGVNPRGVQIVLEAWPRECGPAPRVLDDPSRLPIVLRVDEPGRAGIDRVLNAVAANVLRAPGEPAVIVDCGTATTIDAVSADGAFEGGAILPGIELAARSLHEHTARLPLLTRDDLAAVPDDGIGRNTRAAIQSGVVWGQVGAVRELVGRMGAALRSGAGAARVAASEGGSPPATVFLTGGGAPLLAAHLPQARFEPHLALQALGLVHVRLDG